MMKVQWGIAEDGRAVYVGFATRERLPYDDLWILTHHRFRWEPAYRLWWREKRWWKSEKDMRRDLEDIARWLSNPKRKAEYEGPLPPAGEGDVIEAYRCWECGHLYPVRPWDGFELQRRFKAAVEAAVGRGEILAAAPVPEGVHVVGTIYDRCGG
jgi:hypothetical protein